MLHILPSFFFPCAKWIDNVYTKDCFPSIHPSIHQLFRQLVCLFVLNWWLWLFRRWWCWLLWWWWCDVLILSWPHYYHKMPTHKLPHCKCQIVQKLVVRIKMCKNVHQQKYFIMHFLGLWIKTVHGSMYVLYKICTAAMNYIELNSKTFRFTIEHLDDESILAIISFFVFLVGFEY